MRGPGCPPRLHLEQASAGDWLPGVQQHVEGCEACTVEVKSLQAMTADFLAARPVERFVQQVEAREAAAPRRARSPFAVFAFATAMSGLILFTLAALLGGDPSSGVTLKGGGLAHITLKRGDAVTTLAKDARLAPGDALRFSVVTQREGYAVVLERDATGKVTVVAPFGVKEPKAVNAGTNVLPDSAVLDDVRGRETFITLVSERPFDVQQAVTAYEQQRAFECDCVVEVSTFDKP